jgi:hypothetical protein
VEEIALINYAAIHEEEEAEQQEEAEQINEFVDSLDELFDEAFTNG